ncbi:type II toxin-antitoxin system HicB family antitoxin [Myxococcota bacterium]
MADYIALIRKEGDSAFGVDFPDFPGCISSGATLDEALRDARGALALHIKGMLEDGEEIPAPSTLDAILEDDHNRDAVPSLVTVPEVKSRAVRVNITIDESLLTELDNAAAREGFTRSGYLADAVRAKLKKAG